MPKTPKEKRLNAIAGYQRSLDSWTSILSNESDPDKVKFAKDKIAKHEKAIANTKAALNRY